jgi:hypothetical protein
MAEKSLTEYCFETLSKEVALTRVAGLEDGGGIKVYIGDRASCN